MKTNSRIHDSRECSEIIINSVRHLFSLIEPNGRFVYAHVKDDPSNRLDGYNLLRHCGTAWFMCTAILELRIELAPWQAQLLRKSVSYALRRVREPQWLVDAPSSLCLVTNDSVKLGGNGLAILMFRQYEALRRSGHVKLPALREAPQHLVERLERYVIAQATAEDFLHKRRFSDGEVSTFRSDYYTGEALYGLFSGNEISQEISSVAAAIIQRGYGVDIQSHWMAYAACEAVRHDHFAVDVSASYISSLLTSIVGRDLYRRRRQSTPIACRSEALAICLNTIGRYPEIQRRVSTDLISAAEHCLEENLSTQLDWYSSGQFWRGDDDVSVQIDYIQHNAASFLGWHVYKFGSAAHGLSIANDKRGVRLGPVTFGAVVERLSRHRGFPASVISRPDLEQLKPNVYEASASAEGQDLISSEFFRRGLRLRRFGDIHRFGKDGRFAFTYWADTGFTSQLGFKVLVQKPLGKQLMELAGARTAEGRVFTTSEYCAALEWVRAIAPCVVKPVDGNLARGVTVNVHEGNFKEAWVAARQITSSGILIERFLDGQEARYIVVNNRCVAVLQQTPPFVVGDGRHTIAELVGLKNEHRCQNPFLRDYPIELDDAKLDHLGRQGLDLSSVVPAGDCIALKSNPDLLDGGDSVDITDHADQGLKSIAESITKYLPGLDVIGFDVIAKDHCSPGGGGDYIFLEGNTLPDILEHHFPTYGEPRDIAREIAVSCVSKMNRPERTYGNLSGASAKRPSHEPKADQMVRRSYPSVPRSNQHKELAQRFLRRGFGSSKLGPFLLVEKAGQRVLFDGSMSSFSSRVGARLLRNRDLMNMTLRDSGISVPDWSLFSEDGRDDALEFVRAAGEALIQPSTRQRDSSVALKATEETFDVAWQEALERSSGEILVEKAFGPAISVRCVVVDGQFLSAVRSLPPSVVGDGHSSVAQLVELGNQAGSRNLLGRDTRLELTPDRVRFLLDCGYSLESVPAAGERVLMDSEFGWTSDGDVLACTDEVHAGFRDIAERAYRAFPDLHVAEVEILARDLSLAPSPGNHVVAGVCANPDLGEHLYPAYGESFDLYEIVVSSCLARLNQDRGDLAGVQPVKVTTEAGQALGRGAADALSGRAEQPLGPGSFQGDGPVILQLGDAPAPIVFKSCPEVADATVSILRGWPIEELRDCDEPSMVVSHSGGHYSWARPATGKVSDPKRPLDSLERILTEVHYELIDWYLEDHPDQLCLHAAATEIGGGLVVFPSTHRSGKSLLSVALAMQGFRVFGDDRLAIDQSARLGHSVGMLPRLRRPLPGAAAHAGLRHYVDRHRGITGENHIYVNLPESDFAPRGTASTIHGIVLLDRNNTGKPARLVQASRADGLRALIAQNFHRRFPASQILATLERLVAGSEILTLRYTRLDDAAALLSQHFAPGTAQEVAV